MKKTIAAILLCAPILFSVSGCRRSSESADIVHASATTAKAPVLSADCVTIFYNDDGSEYISRQQHLITLNPAAITITAKEPWGRAQCSLAGAEYHYNASREPTEQLSIWLNDRTLAKTILISALAGTGYITETGGTELGQVRIEGQFYQPIELKPKANDWAKVTVYRNMQNQLTELVKVTDGDTGRALWARNYNRRRLEEVGVDFAMKIDVFSADNAAMSEKQLLQISY